MNATVELSNVSYATRANAKRALKKICTKCVQHSKEIIVEVDGRFHFDESLVEKYMSHDEWNEVWGAGNAGLPDETIKPSDEAEIAATLDAEEKYETPAMRVQQAVATAVRKETQNPLNVPHPENLHDNGCPYCGDTDNGITYDDEPTEEQDDLGSLDNVETRYENQSMVVQQAVATAIRTEIKREAQKTSMKLDRRITVVGSGEIYKNANAMWKANPSWMTSAQEDTLTKKLYEAAKKGDKIVVEINGRSFELVNV